MHDEAKAEDTVHLSPVEKKGLTKIPILIFVLYFHFKDYQPSEET